jgi:hypothetical protein
MIKTHIEKKIFMLILAGACLTAGLLVLKPKTAQAQAAVPAGCVPLPQTITGGVVLKANCFKVMCSTTCEQAWGTAVCSGVYVPTYQGSPNNAFSCGAGSHKWPITSYWYNYIQPGDPALFFCVSD